MSNIPKMGQLPTPVTVSHYQRVSVSNPFGQGKPNIGPSSSCRKWSKLDPLIFPFFLHKTNDTVINKYIYIYMYIYLYIHICMYIYIYVLNNHYTIRVSPCYVDFMPMISPLCTHRSSPCLALYPHGLLVD